MEDPHLALRFVVALALGMLLGLERERTKGQQGGAGVRTFALIALAGALGSAELRRVTLPASVALFAAGAVAAVLA